jgi:hypothetical protein
MATTLITNTINPIPVRDDIVGSNKHMNQVWEFWFRKLYNIVLNQSTIKSVGTFNYTLDGNRIFFNYAGTGGVIIDLPFPVLYKTNLSVFSINAGDKKITIPNLPTGTILNEWFFVDVN